MRAPHRWIHCSQQVAYPVMPSLRIHCSAEDADAMSLGNVRHCSPTPSHPPCLQDCASCCWGQHAGNESKILQRQTRRRFDRLWWTTHVPGDCTSRFGRARPPHASPRSRRRCVPTNTMRAGRGPVPSTSLATPSRRRCPRTSDAISGRVRAQRDGETHPQVELIHGGNSFTKSNSSTVVTNSSTGNSSTGATHPQMELGWESCLQ